MDTCFRDVYGLDKCISNTTRGLCVNVGDEWWRFECVGELSFR